MSIAEHSTLTHAVPWQVKVTPVGTDVVQEVDFLIDGKKRWVEQVPPYVFDDDHQLLAPWVLGNGPHTLTAHVLTIDGATADETAHVRVRADLKQDRAIAGTYSRVVTKADQRRTQSYRVASKGAFGDISDTGRWTLHINPNGEIVVNFPGGAAADTFVEPYLLAGSRVTVYGPAVWRQPDPTHPNLFCEPERPGEYTWKLSGAVLTITTDQKVCADRDIVFVGTWTRS
jgi:hypothetical protein